MSTLLILFVLHKMSFTSFTKFLNVNFLSKVLTFRKLLKINNPNPLLYSSLEVALWLTDFGAPCCRIWVFHDLNCVISPKSSCFHLSFVFGANVLWSLVQRHVWAGLTPAPGGVCRARWRRVQGVSRQQLRAEQQTRDQFILLPEAVF